MRLALASDADDSAFFATASNMTQKTECASEIAIFFGRILANRVSAAGTRAGDHGAERLGARANTPNLNPNTLGRVAAVLHSGPLGVPMVLRSFWDANQPEVLSVVSCCDKSHEQAFSLQMKTGE